ncbi:MAG: hypothetical protein HUJ59_05175 [Bacilli bacterium]|nr:hypothetical protein [Bacilli bacterium]
MTNTFTIFEFRYVDKDTGTGFCVYARTEETADKIIAIENEQNVYFFIKPKLRRFKRKYTTEKPPYELEQEQLDFVTKRRNKRLKYIAEKKDL